MDMTFFDDIQAVKQRPADMTWATFCNLVARPPVAMTKRDLRWIKFALYGDRRSKKGCVRCDANVVALTGIELDYDSPNVGIDVAGQRLAMGGIQAALHSTPSYWKKGSYRVLVPFKGPVYEDLKATRAYRIDQVARVIGETPARESYVLSQAYYFGRVSSDTYVYGITSSEGSWLSGAVYPDWPNIFTGVAPEFLRGAPAF